MDRAQTKRRRRRPWCVDGAYVLGLGAAAPQAMVGAKATGRHGVPETNQSLDATMIFLTQKVS